MAKKNKSSMDEVKEIKAGLLAQKKEQKRALQIQNALYKIADAASSARNMQSFYKKLHKVIGELMYAKSFYVILYDAERNILGVENGGYWSDAFGDPMPPSGSLTKYEKTPSAVVIQSGKTMHLPREKMNEMTEGGILKPYGSNSVDWIGVPLKDKKKTFGVLVIQSYEERVVYSEEDVKLLEFVGQHIATALTRVRAIEETRQRNAELAIINSVQEGLAKQLDFQGIIDLIGEKVQEIFKADTTAVGMVDPERDWISNAYYVDRGKRMSELEGPVPRPSLVAIAVDSRKPLLFGTAEEMIKMGAVRTPSPGEKVDMNESFLGVPILAGKKLVGLISVQSYQQNAYNQDDMRLLETLANAMSVALQNVQSFEAEQQRVAELQIINSVQQGLVSKLDMQSIYELVGDKISEITKSEIVVINTWDSEKEISRYEYILEKGKRGTVIERPFTRLAREITVPAMEEGRTLVWNDGMAERLEQYEHSLPAGEMPLSVLNVPVKTGNRINTSISLQDARQENAFGDSIIRLVETLAGSMGVALESARLFDETQRLFEAEQARVAELAIVNSVQAGLASKLDMLSIYELVGDKIAEVTGEDAVLIQTWNIGTGIRRDVYSIEKGIKTGVIPEHKFTPVEKVIISALQEGKTILWNDGMKERIEQGGHTQFVVGGMPLSILVVPLKTAKADVQSITSISLQNISRENAFSESDVRLVETLANAMSVSLENARLFDETQRLLKETEERNAELAVINSVQQALAAELDMQGIYDAVGDKIREIFDAQGVVIGTLDRETGEGIFHYFYEKGERFYPEPITQTGLMKHLVKTGQKVVINENLSESAKKYGMKIPAGENSKSAVWIPIKSGNTVRGVVSLQNIDRENAFSDSDVRLLETLTSSMSVALENARLFDETQRLLKETEQRNAELAIVNSVQLGLASKLDMQSIFELIGEKIRTIFDAQVTIIATYDFDSDQASYRYVAEKGERFDGITVPFNDFHRKMIGERKTILYNENLVEQVKALGFKKSLTPNDLPKSALNVPLFVGDQVLGHVALENLEHEHAFSESDVRLLETLANSMSVALESARLFDETQRLLDETEQRAAELALINSVQQGLASKLDIQAIIDLVGDKIRDVFDTQTTYIALHNQQSRTFYIPYYLHRGQRMVVEGNHSADKGLTAHIIQTRKTLLFNEDADRITRKLGATNVADDDKPQSWLGVPMIAGDEVVGVISLQNIEHENAYSKSDVSLLTTIASSLAVALQNAQLFEETKRLLKETEERNAELAVITSVQKGLVSKLEFQSIIDLVGDKIRDIFDAQATLISLYDPESKKIDHRYLYERNKRLHIHEPIPIDKFRQRVVETHQSWLINQDYQKITSEIGEAPVLEGEEPKSLLFVPMIVGDEVTGIISLQNLDRENAFSDTDVRLLSTIAASMSVALENARLFEETQRLFKAEEQRAAELQIINSVGQVLTQELDLQSLVNLVGDKLRKALHAESFGIGLYDVSNKLLHTAFAYKNNARVYTKPAPLNPYSLRLAKQGKSIIINRNTRRLWKKFGSNLTIGDDIPKSVILVPILAGKRLIGGITLQDFHQENAFSDSVVRLIETIASNMGTAIQNARLFEESQRLLRETEERAAELAAINNVQQSLASKPDFQGTIDLVGDKLRQVLKTGDLSIRWYDPEMNLVHHAYEYESGERLSIQPMPPRSKAWKKMAATLQPVVMNTSADLAAMDMLPVQGTESGKSTLYVPIISGNQLMGFIVREDKERENAFKDADVRLLSTIASSLGVALENARLFDETQRLLKETEQRAGELSAVSTISQALVAETELDKLISLIGSQTREIFDADIAYLALLDSQTNFIQFPYSYGEDFNPLKLGDGLTSKIIQTGEPLLINKDIKERREQLGTSLVGKEALSYLGVPIRSGKDAIGVLSVQSTTEEEVFDDDDLRLLTTIAANAGAAIQTAQLHAETQRRAREMATLAEIGNDIAASRELEPVLERIATHAKEILRVRDIAIYLRDGEKLYVPVALGTYTEEIKAQVISIGQGITGAIAQTGVAELINDPAHDLRVVHVPGTPEEDDEHESMMVAPLISRGQVIGVISVWRPHTDNLFAQADLDFLVSVARQTAIAIESARLYLETQHRAREMSALVDVGRDISASLDAETVLESIAKHAKELLKGDLSALFLPEGDGSTFRAIAAVGHEAEKVRNDTINQGQGILGNIAKNKLGEIVNDVNNDPRAVTIVGTDISPDEHLLAVPLMANDKLNGLMAVWRSGKGLEFIEAELEFLSGLSRQAVIAVQNAQLFDEINRRKEYFEVLFQNNPVAVVTIDNDARVTSWNPAAEQLFGYTQQEALAKNVDDLVASLPELYSEAVGYSNTGLAVDSGAFQVLAKRTRKDGSLVDVELSGVPIVVQDKKLGMYALYHDITELQRARQEAVAANEAKSAFLATMSHEIRTPMNAVIGMSGLLLDTKLDKEQLEYAETIRNSGDALLAIINDILDFSKIEAGKMELEQQPFDLRECVESALDLVAARAVDKGLDLAYLIDDDVPGGIRGDVTRLRQILLNLLSNAVKFTEKGEVVLTVSKPRSGENELLFTVRDTGVGISQGHMNRLFQSFSQADSSTTRKFGGTGLGLAISKRLAEMMGGNMWADSDGVPGKGSTFSFTIQAKRVKLATRKSKRDIRSLQPALQDKRVLVVDDNATNRRILKLQTEKWGMLPRATKSPKQAIRWIKAGEPFELAILDMQMPDMDGLTLARSIRKKRDAEELPIILLTSLGRREVGADDMEFAAFLTKPLKPSALFDTLASLFADSIIQPKREPAKLSLDPEMAKRNPLRILLAEDNAVNQKLALRFLEQMGYRADVASNGIEAVESIERQMYDVILMDVQMPEMDGLEATRQIRKMDIIQPYIIAMTANAMQGDREMCLEAGMNFYVAKPIRVPELVAALNLVREKTK